MWLLITTCQILINPVHLVLFLKDYSKQPHFLYFPFKAVYVSSLKGTDTELNNSEKEAFQIAVRFIHVEFLSIIEFQIFVKIHECFHLKYKQVSQEKVQ